MWLWILKFIQAELFSWGVTLLVTFRAMVSVVLWTAMVLIILQFIRSVWPWDDETFKQGEMMFSNLMTGIFFIAFAASIRAWQQKVRNVFVRCQFIRETTRLAHVDSDGGWTIKTRKMMTRIKKSMKEYPLPWGIGASFIVLCIVLYHLDKDTFGRIGQTLVGVGSGIGIAIATWRQLVLQKLAKAIYRKQATSQLIRAMELLTRVNSNGKPLKEARIDGLYRLESLAHDESEVYVVQVMKTIVAYIRENAQKTSGETDNADTSEQYTRPLGEDVKEAFAVLKRLYDRYASTPEKRGKIKLVRFFDNPRYVNNLTSFLREPVYDDLDFSRADFHQLDFRNIKWIDRPCCERTNFQEANLWRANWEGAHLEGALLQGAYAFNIDLRQANLRDVRLHGANLNQSKLERANFYAANSCGADFSLSSGDSPNFEYTILELCKFDSANITYKKLSDEEPANKSIGIWVPWEVLTGRDVRLHIFCDEDFLSSVGGENLSERIDPNDEQGKDGVGWFQRWRYILKDIRQDSKHYAIRGFIDIHGCMRELKETRCAEGLRAAINELIKEHPAITAQLPEDYLIWLNKKHLI